jgi:hypothetical protein
VAASPQAVPEARPSNRRALSVLSTLLEELRVHARTIIPVGAVVAVGVVVVGLLIGLYAVILGRVAYLQLVEWANAPETFTTATLVIIVPMLLLCAVACLVWAGVAVQVANAAATSRRISTGGAALASLRAVPRAAAIALLVPVSFVLAVLAAPILVLVGLVGLVVNRAQLRWRTRSLVILAVPFGAALYLLLRWSLALPSLWLAGTSVRAALADSATRTVGRKPMIGVVLLLSGLVTFGASEGLVALVGLAGIGSYPEFVTRLVAMILVGPLVPVALALQYRAGGAVPAAPAVKASVSRRTRIAVAVITSLVIPFVLSSNPAPAAAAGTEAVAFVIGTVESQPLSTTAATTLTFSVTNAVTAEVTQPTGELAIAIDGSPLTGPFTLAGGGAVLQVPYTFSDGSHLIEAVYGGDLAYAAETASLTVSAAAPPPDSIFTTTDMTITPAGTTAPGTELTAHVTVSPNTGSSVPQGSVALFRPGVSAAIAAGTLVSGATDLTFTLPPGTIFVTAVYTPDAGFYGSDYGLYHVTSPYPPGVTLTSLADETVFGEAAEFTATVTASVTPTGSVRFEATPAGGSATVLDTVPLTGGVAVLTTAALAVGDATVVAYYEGDGTVAADSSDPLAHSVVKAPAAVALTSSVDTPRVGDLVSITVTVTASGAGAGTPSGTATVYRDSVEVGTVSLNGAGVGTLSNVSVGDAGTRAFTADYDGDGNFETGSGSLTLPVAKVDTETHLFAPLDDTVAYGDSQTYSGSVSTDEGVATGTVTVYVGGTIVGTATLSGGTYSLTTTTSPAGSGAISVWAVYNGDTNHDGSDSRATTPGITVMVSKSASAPVLTASPGPYTVGDTVTLTATLADLGAGPSGTVTFTSGAAVLGTVAITGHTASLSYLIAATSLPVTAGYAGDGNFSAGSSSALALTAAKALPVVSIAPVGARGPGELFALVATVTLPGGIAPTGTVDFRDASGSIGTAAVVDGQAVLTACAGSASECPTGVALGRTARDVFARYSETPIALQADSATAAYTFTPYATVTTLTVNPTTVQPNSGIQLTATVDATDYTPAPTGSVNFYGIESGAEYFLVNVPLVNGVATQIVTVGDGLTELRWPAEGVRARYAPDPLFSSSVDTKTVTVDRYDLSLSLFASAATINTPTPITVYLDHEPGTSEPYTGDLVVTADTGSTCTVPGPITGRVASCSITWTTAGVHSVSATYDGDLFYEPATGGPTAIGFGTGTPALAPVLSSNPVAEFDSTVYWQLFDAGATGTVTVWGDGVLWCSVPIGARQCTSQFGVGAATGSPVDVVVRYSGDANWAPSEQVLSATVRRCVTPDVTSSSPSLGTVSITTPSNCGTGGYLSGTLLTATATPISPNVFVNWKRLGGSGFVVDTTSATIAFTVTTDFMTWTRLATFSTPCYPVTAAATGRGGISVYPAPNCTTSSGVAGYTRGTAITAYPDALYNPQYSENDVFYAFGSAPGLTPGVDSSNRPLARATVTGPLTIPVTFGPVCRAVSVTFEPASAGDSARAAQAENCHSPQGNGYLRHSTVTIAAVPGSPSAVIAGWSMNGVPQAGWGSAAEQTVVIGAIAPALTVQLVNCYLLDVTVDGAEAIDSFAQVGRVTTSVQPNCPDGSARYLAGTQVTLTPEILVDKAAFTGWDSQRLAITPSPTGVLVDKALTFTMTANFAVSAGFYFADSCSSIQILSAPGIVDFEDDGCGPGQYFDLQKQYQLRNADIDPDDLVDKARTELVAHVNSKILMDVYVSLQGDVRNCFGNTAAGGAATVIDGWATYGPLTGRETCEVGGPIRIDVDVCQRFDASPQFQVQGLTQLFSRSAIPDQLLLPDGSGRVGSFDLNAFEWMQSGTVGVDAAGGLTVSNLGPDPCTRSGANTYPLNRSLGLFAYGPSTGFSPSGWLDANGTVGTQNPILTTTTPVSASRQVTPVFTLTCHRLALGRGITVVGTPARCPGYPPSENWFIEGTAVQVRAALVADDRDLHGFESGVVAGQIAEESATSKALIGFVVVDADKRVTGDYPTKTEAVARAIVQNLKVVVGVLSIMAPIALGMVFPPAGMFFAFLGAMAGIANMIPHGGPVASMFDLVNPTKITTCAARWGFTNAGDPTGGYGVGSLLSGTNTLRKVWQGKDVIFEKVGPLGIAGGAAALGYGLYEAGAGKVDLSPQTVEQLAGTSTMTGCLNQQWKAAGANV